MTGRDLAGILAEDLVFLLVGFATLGGLGFVRSRASALRFAGLGLFLGWAALGVLASLALVAGASLTLWELLVLGAVWVAGGVVASRRVNAMQLLPAGREHGLARMAAFGSVIVLVLYLVDLLRVAVVEVTTAWDANGYWVLKSAAIVGQNGLHTGPGQFATFTNPTYPIFSPVQDAITWRFTGTLDAGALPTQHWIVAVSFLAAAAGLLAGRVRSLFLWPGLALVALLPAFEGLIGSSLGDEPLAMLLSLAALTAAVWLVGERDPRLLVVCGILLVAAAWTKVEGLPGALLVGAMLALATRLRAWRSVLPLIAAPLVLIAPWRIWMSAHHIPSTEDVPYSRLLDPTFLWDTRARLGTALAQVPRYLLDPGAWLLSVPVAVLLAALLIRRRPDVGVFVLGFTFFASVGNAAVYWISSLPIHWYIETSAARVVSSNAMTSALLAPLLLSFALAPSSAAKREAAATQVRKSQLESQPSLR